MATTTTKSSFLKGFRNGLPFLLVAGPFAMLFGVMGTEAGLNIAQVMGFTAMVIAGAAQFAAVQMMVENASVVLILIAALTVNLRMAMYSAALVPWLGKAPLWQRALIAYANFDQTFIVSMNEYEEHPTLSVSQRVAFFLGVTLPLVTTWISMTLVGTLVGSSIPPSVGLDFALPITFLAMIAPALRTRAHVAAAVVSVVLAVGLNWLPSGTGLLIAAAAAMVTGAAVETWMERKA